jgi:tetratricopeptide (TPR) repeat protein
MRAEWEPDELIDVWTLGQDDWRLVGNKTGATRLGFSLMLKFYEIEGRFPAYAEEVPSPAVGYLASLVKVDAALFAKYAWSGRTIEYHRAQIRRRFGTRPATEADEERWAVWLAAEVCPVDTSAARLGDAVRQRCRSEGVEPPAEGQLERVVASAARRFEEAFAVGAVERMGPGVCARLQALLARPGLLGEVKADPGSLGLDTLLAEIAKLTTVRALGLADDLFADVSARVVAAWRARAMRMFPSDFEECGEPVRYTLLATLCWTRQSELVDGLVELLIGLIHRINARAERRVEKEIIGELARVPGKRGILGRMVNAALERPDDTVRRVVFPAVPGGEKTLRSLAKELMATEKVIAERVRYQLRGSYSHYYRRMLTLALAAGRSGDAEALYRQSLQVAQELTELEPGNTTYRRDLSISYERLADLALAAGRSGDAEALYRQSLQVAQELTELEPGNTTYRRDLSISYERLADLALAAGRSGDAEALYRQSLQVAQELTELEPGNTTYRRDLSISYERLADLALAAGRSGDAEALYRQSLQVAQELTELEPGNTTYRRDLSISYERLADLALAAGRSGDAEALYRQSLQVAQELTELEPGNTTYRRDLSISYERLGGIAADTGQPVEARRCLTIALDARRGLHRQEPQRVDLAEELGVTLYLVAGTADDPGEAQQEVVEILVPFEQAGTITPKGAALLSWARQPSQE